MAKAASGAAALLVLILFSLAVYSSCSKSPAKPRAGLSVTQPVASDFSDAGMRSADAGGAAAEFVPSSDIERELHAKLMAEFDRLGIDPERAVAKAPAGADSAVFDLSARIVYEDGEIWEQPTGIELEWTERLVGDYDQSGEVGIPDITPIALNYLRNATYKPPAEAGGLKYWPLGDPTDGGGAASGDPPAEGSGAENWRLARIDGDATGEIGISDVTPIALHYLERLDGYRVYRKGPEEEFFKFLRNPADESSNLTVTRTDFYSAENSACPIRYTFTDRPPKIGEYEYYVTAFANGYGESLVQSSRTTIGAPGFGDTTPPVWDDTVGITGAIANEDGSVTVEFGTATDLAVPPAPASPPVTYAVYYSTESPIDFGAAAKVTGVAGSPWTSIPLIGGRTYFFAVRAMDSAEPPNEDSNSNELAVTALGEQVEDTEPPVWVIEIQDGTTSGFERILTRDGKLIIRRDDAIDELSPPVHYDLYFLSYRVSSNMFVSGQLHPDVQVLKDIPKEFDFPWENHHGVHLHVKARDSAVIPNETKGGSRLTAPTNRIQRTLNLDLPYMTEEYTSAKFESSSVFDPAMRTIHAIYYPDSKELFSPRTPGVFYVKLNTDTLAYVVEQLMPTPAEDAFYTQISLKLSWTGELWANIWQSGHGNKYLRKPAGGIWQEWDASKPPNSWWGHIGHTGTPVVFTTGNSDVAYNRVKVYYNWWDSDSQQWVKEFVSDPGSIFGTMRVRPDGVVQFVQASDIDTVWGGSEGTTFSRIHERSIDGTWTQKFQFDGWIGADKYFPETWDAKWAWGFALEYHNGIQKQYAYGLDGGYEMLEYLGKEGFTPSGKPWPASGSSYHLLPDYINISGELKELYFGSREYDVNILQPRFHIEGSIAGILGGGYVPETGYMARLGASPDFEAGKWAVKIWTTPPGVNIFDP